MRNANEIIASEVYMNINTLISDVIMRDNDLMCEFLENTINPIDWQEVVNEIGYQLDTETIEELLTELGLEDLSEVDTTDESTIDTLIDFCENNGMHYQDYESEAFEYYAISDWLHTILNEVGYPVSEIAGMYVMCRTTTGQSLSMDYVWTQVTERMVERTAS